MYRSAYRKTYQDASRDVSSAFRQQEHGRRKGKRYEVKRGKTLPPRLKKTIEYVNIQKLTKYILARHGRNQKNLPRRQDTEFYDSMRTRFF